MNLRQCMPINVMLIKKSVLRNSRRKKIKEIKFYGKTLRKEFSQFSVEISPNKLYQKRQITSLHKKTSWLKFLFNCLLRLKNQTNKLRTLSF